ncbi:lysozyme inhibitor LprI family protein [Rummeliibacillus sp. NPDC094406]|uniref:lysozyme inhibitor LprI family protein n=1 Tax=Rummeliibacillus sp. NPDC094406 TaxID=3364511 RepID=UPI00380B5070
MRKLSYILLVGLLLAGCGNSGDLMKNAESVNSTYTKAVEQGKLALTDGDIDKALASFELALDEKPKDLQAKKYVTQLKKTQEIENLIEDKKYKKAMNQADTLLSSTNILISVNGQVENLRQEAKRKQDKELAAKKKKEQTSSSNISTSQPQQQTKNNMYQVYSNQASSIVSNYDNPAESIDGTTMGSEDKMINAENARYGQWDALLNDIYGTLKTKLSASDFNSLRNYQNQWIHDRDATADQASIDAESMDSYTPKVTHAMTLAESTKERCYELLNDYAAELQR